MTCPGKGSANSLGGVVGGAVTGGCIGLTDGIGASLCDVAGGATGRLASEAVEGSFGSLGRYAAEAAIGGLTGGLANRFADARATEEATVQYMRPVVGSGLANIEGRNAARLAIWGDVSAAGGFMMAGRILLACSPGL